MYQPITINYPTDTQVPERLVIAFEPHTKSGVSSSARLVFWPTTAISIERAKSEYPRWQVHKAPKSVREAEASQHTPGVYTTPVAFTSAFVFD